MGLSSAVQWWEEWQLRILVLASLTVQCYLVFFSSARKIHIRPLYRFLIWVAYLGGDALAIYALATLFNRHQKLQHQILDSGRDLEVLWAPILLMHLGGQINISAYNIEDNELWRRHFLTAVAQVAVAIYVFCKSWSSPAADERLLAATILVFVLGVFKCFEKPFALKRASFNSLVISFHPAPRTKAADREVELEKYIQEARNFANLNRDPPTLDSSERLQHMEWLSMPDKLFVDFAYAYTDRLTKLESFFLLGDKKVYAALSKGLSETFNLIYSKQPQSRDSNREITMFDYSCSLILFFVTRTLPIVPIILFHCSRKEAFRSSDIKITFSLLYITYLLEIISFFTLLYFDDVWPDVVAQHNLIGFLAHNRRHRRFMGIAEVLQCKGLIDTYFCLKPCYSSEDITNLIQCHVKTGWMNYISDIESFWKFSDIRGHWTLQHNGCEEIVWSIEKPFDESIILWHVATDFCFHHKGVSPDSRRATLCREISNYMVHLLFSNPEMLIPGSRRTLFTDAYNELEALLQDEDASLLEEKQITEKIIQKIGSGKGFVHDSWILAQKLMQLGDEKTWEVIKGVWVEMLCFSASRCRGYLHAKSLGSGGEYLSFVSLLMSHAGLETFAERQQRVQLRLLKDERVKIAKQRIQNVAINQATPSATEASVPGKQQENAAAAATSASQGQFLQALESLTLSKLHLQLLNLSMNDLNGLVPSTGIFESHSFIYLDGNPKRCYSSMACYHSQYSSDRRKVHIVIVVAAASAAAISILGVIFVMLKSRRHLANATTRVAGSFIRRNHWLISYEELCQVYELMSNGSLEDWIQRCRQHENGAGLNAEEVLHIAIDVASALEYRHNDCGGQVVHCDIKPSNVLLDGDMNAKIGDFGLARLLAPVQPEQQSVSSIHGLIGSIGYIPPEYGFGSIPSTRGDVYSYGVMLLEMITGKSPLEKSFGGDMDLTKWVQDNFPHQAHDVIDKRLISAITDAISEGVQESNTTEQLLLNLLLVPMLEVALSCVDQSPDKRSSMHDSLLRLKQMKETYLRNRSTMYRDRRADV